MTFEEVNEEISRVPGDRVTISLIQGAVAKVDYVRMNDTLTLCSLTLNNGFCVCGSSACVDPANYNQQVGEHLAHKHAMDKLWPLFGFLMTEARYRRMCRITNTDFTFSPQPAVKSLEP